MSKPSIPKGTRDFSPGEMARRNYILDTIKKYFRLYGFEQIETPAMENLSTLTGKYGEEGDKLIFKILNSGDYLDTFLTRRIKPEFQKINEEVLKIEEIGKKIDAKIDLVDASNYLSDALNSLSMAFKSSFNINSKLLSEFITEKALRYDLTVPFARYVVQHQSEITFPFKRFQVQPVWRADKPQKGRYREFYQCDADMIGSDSLVNEIELVQLMFDVYAELDLPTVIKINNRKILSGIAEVIGEKERIIDITIAIDKLDKIGIEGVNQELLQGGVKKESVEKLQPLLSFKGNDQEKLNFLETLLSKSETGLKGIAEAKYILDAGFHSKNSKLELDITLARGLNYYTGAIFEVKANAGTFTPSITGGGRYDDLTGIFGLPNMSGVGISFGIDRIYDVMEELNLFPEEKLNKQHTQILLMHMGEAEQQHGLKMLNKLRKAGIRSEIYPDVTKKLNKQFDYATKKDIPYAIVIGSNEITSGKYTLKTKDNKLPDLTLEEIIRKIS